MNFCRPTTRAPAPGQSGCSLRRRRLLAGGAAWAVGCASARADDALTELRVAVFPQLDRVIDAFLPRWHERHPDVALKIESRNWVDHHFAMTTALSTTSHLPGVMALDTTFLDRFMRGGGLQDLRQPPFGIGSWRGQWVAGAYDQATDQSGAVLAAPSDVGPGTMFYRADLLERAGVEPARLSDSWDSYINAGRQILARTGARLIGHALDVNNAAAYAGISAGGGLYYDAANRVLVDEPHFARAFELARQIRREGLDARHKVLTSGWLESLRRGHVATAINGAWLSSQLSSWLAPGTAGLWRSAPLPEGAAVSYGGTYYAIPRHLPLQVRLLAWDFVRMMTLDPQVQLEAFRRFDAFPSLQTTYGAPFFDEPISFLGGQRARRQWTEIARRVPAVRIHKQDAFAVEVVSTELDRVLDQGKDIATALGDARRLLQRRALR